MNNQEKEACSNKIKIVKTFQDEVNDWRWPLLFRSKGNRPNFNLSQIRR